MSTIKSLGWNFHDRAIGGFYASQKRCTDLVAVPASARSKSNQTPSDMQIALVRRDWKVFSSEKKNKMAQVQEFMKPRHPQRQPCKVRPLSTFEVVFKPS
jgi:hypothetical protein